MSANRQHKSSVFSTLFGDPDVFLELYNALTSGAYSPSTKVVPATLTDVLFMDRQNDIAFVIGDVIVVLIEHQASINNNMPLRLLLYIAKVYELIIDNADIYREKLLRIPKPEFIVLYNGTDSFPNERTLKLSDAFKQSPEPGLGGMLELSVRVVNINKGFNQDIIQNSDHLRGYVDFIAMVRDNQIIGMGLRDAVATAVTDCLKKGILVGFLKRHSSEVINMLTTEFDINIAKRVWQEEAHEDGIQEGIEIGREEGRIYAAVNAVKNWQFSLTDALVLVELGEKYREQVVKILQDKGINFTS